jgi:hypothetical protein
MAGVVAGAEAGFHRMSLKNTRKIVRGGKRSKKGIAKKPTITTFGKRRHGSLRLRVGRAFVAAIFHGVPVTP